MALTIAQLILTCVVLSHGNRVGLASFIALSIGIDLLVPPWAECGYLCLAVLVFSGCSTWTLVETVLPARNGRLLWLLHYYVDHPLDVARPSPRTCSHAEAQQQNPCELSNNQ
eukprot:SAG31_NODE_1366_length_8621_cov_4.579911_1_plen_113_part_00